MKFFRSHQKIIWIKPCVSKIKWLKKRELSLMKPDTIESKSMKAAESKDKTSHIETLSTNRAVRFKNIDRKEEDISIDSTLSKKDRENSTAKNQISLEIFQETTTTKKIWYTQSRKSNKSMRLLRCPTKTRRNFSKTSIN